MACQVELIPISEGNRITIKENEKLMVGRGSSLGCDDKKISRQHAELFMKTDQTFWIKPIHTNPLFYRPFNGKTTQLTKDTEQQLKENDQIGLLPSSFFFRVSFSTDLNSKPDEPSSPVKDQTDESARKLPAWMSTSDKSTPPTDRPSTKRQLSSEVGNDVKTDNPSNAPDVAAKSIDADDDDETFDSFSPKKRKATDKRREVCPYGASCYRKNPSHRTEQSHPGDSDYEDEKQTKDDSAADRPECPYGKTCYRQNPQHKRDYKH